MQISTSLKIIFSKFGFPLFQDEKRKLPLDSGNSSLLRPRSNWLVLTLMKNMCFGKKRKINFTLKLNGSPIDWVESWKYLGVVLKAGPAFGCSVADRVKSFYRSLNSILRVEGRSEDMILLRLIESHCVLILSYAIEIVHVADRDKRRSLRVAYNSIFRKLFGYRPFESVTDLQPSPGDTGFF